MGSQLLAVAMQLPRTSVEGDSLCGVSGSGGLRTTPGWPPGAGLARGLQGTGERLGGGQGAMARRELR